MYKWVGATRIGEGRQNGAISFRPIAVEDRRKEISG